MSKLNKDEATALCIGNNNYVDLLKVLPWVQPSRSWYEVIQAKALSGIANIVIIKCYEDREKLTQLKVNRIKKNIRFPQAEIVAGHATKSDEEYIETLKGFWSVVLGKLQTGDYPLSPDEAPYLYKMYWLREIARHEEYVFKYIAMKLDNSLATAVTVAASLPRLDKVVLAREYNSDMSVTRGQYLKNFGGYVHYNTPASVLNERCDRRYVRNVLEQYETTYSGMADEIEVLYDLLYRLNCFGYMNDTLVNGEYEMYFY